MNVQIRIRTIFYSITVAAALLLLYTQRHILTPFIIAMVFAYVFNPLINFFLRKFKLPRTLSIILVYLLLIVSVVISAFLLTRSIVGESTSIARNMQFFTTSLKKGISESPYWLRPYLYDYLDYISNNQFLNTFIASPFPIFTKAFSGILGLFVFLFSAFFFLRDSQKMIDKVLTAVPVEYREDVVSLFRQMNTVLSSYLRGQMILIASMILMLFTAFTILGVRYAVTLSVLSALFEIVPIIGPIVASIIGTFVIVISGGVQNFPLNTVQSVIMILAIFYFTRQIQDYLIAPYVIGKATKLHPLVILFSVLAGEHIYGVLGVLLAVPVAASLKIIYIFVLTKLEVRKQRSTKGSV